MSESSGAERIELAVSDQSELSSLEVLLRLAAPDAAVSRISGLPDHGELGALDVLAAVAGSSGLVTAIRVLPEFLRSRRSGLAVTVTAKNRSVTLEASNIDEVMPILEKLLDG